MSLLNFLSKHGHRIYQRLHVLGWLIWRKPKDFKDTPIIINNFNRLDCLKRLIESLEQRGYRNIYILDNNSTYPPLLDFYSDCKYEVIKLGRNVGYLALWETDTYKRFWKGYYVYTDPDVIPDKQCPDNFLEHFWQIAHKYKKCLKVGFGLHIDDLPDHFNKKQEVIDWENQFWEKEIEPGVYCANIDTTFALYKPYTFGGGNIWFRKTLKLRTGMPYMAHHIPWYADSNNPSEEDMYYTQHSKTSTHWTSKTKEGASDNQK